MNSETHPANTSSNSPASSKIAVEVVYALPHEQQVVNLQVDSQLTIEQIIEQSGLLQRYPEIDLATNKVGIYSKLAKLDAKAKDKDRIEIYRPLVADPREIRRKREQQAKAKREAEKKA